MADPNVISELASIASATKDLTLTSMLVWVVVGFVKQMVVSGITYKEQVCRAEKAEAALALVISISDRATRTAEELVHVVREIRA
jgi:hypothetical protein